MDITTGIPPCPFCAWDTMVGHLHCGRCGGRIAQATPGERLLAGMQRLRVMLRNRSWSRLAESAQAVQEGIKDARAWTPPVRQALVWIAHDLAQLLSPLHGAEVVKMVAQAKNVLPLLPEAVAAPLHARCDEVSKFLDMLGALEKQMKEKGAPSAEKIKGWLEPRAAKVGLAFAEAHACIYANPGRWPTLAAALDPTAHQTARRLIKCAAGEKELREKNYGRAKKLFAEALTQNSGCVRAWEGLGLVEAALKNMSETIRCLREAVRLGTREARTFNNLAWYLTTEGTPTPAELDEALVHAERAVELAPCEGFCDTLAEVHWRRREWAAALAAARVACSINPARQVKLLLIAADFQKSRADLAAAEQSPSFELSLDMPVEEDEESDAEFERSLDDQADSQVLGLDEGVDQGAMESGVDLLESARSVDLDEDSEIDFLAEAVESEECLHSDVVDTGIVARSWSVPNRPAEAVQTTPPRPITDQVQFTVTSQKELAPGEPTLIDVWAHLDSQRKDVLERAKEAQRGEDIANRSHAGVALARGSSVCVQLKLPGFEVLEPENTIVWQGDIGNASFPVRTPENVRRGKHLGTVLFHVGGLMIARLHFDVVVGGAQAPGAPLPAQTTRCRSAFASYSSKDRDEVIGRIQGMQKMLPSLDVFLDVAAMRSGENWEARLRDEIKRRDVFYLFWSANARQSKEVEKEWRMALVLRGPEYIDPVPLAPPDVVPPPPELADKHFNDWVLAFRRNRTIS